MDRQKSKKATRGKAAGSKTTKRRSTQKKSKQRQNLAVRRRMEIIVIVGCALMAVIVGYAWSKNTKKVGQAKVNQDVQAYEPLIAQYAAVYQVEDYVPVIAAMMQQESSGQGTDVMQCSECHYNTAYEQSPGSIKDPEYSIDTGIHYFADCLELAECRGPDDTKRLKLALQGYNYGHNYISWAIRRDGGYTEENAQAFSDMMKEDLGWSVYGDPSYPEHVLRYYEE